MSTPAIRDGMVTILAHEPAALESHAAALGLDVAGSVDPDSPEGRILTAMCGGRESVIARICDALTVTADTLPSPQAGDARAITDPKANEPEPAATTRVMPAIQQADPMEAPTQEFPRAARDEDLKAHLRILIQDRATAKLGTGVDLTPVLGPPRRTALGRTRKKEGKS